MKDAGQCFCIYTLLLWKSRLGIWNEFDLWFCQAYPVLDFRPAPTTLLRWGWLADFESLTKQSQCWECGRNWKYCAKNCFHMDERAILDLKNCCWICLGIIDFYNGVQKSSTVFFCKKQGRHFYFWNTIPSSFDGIPAGEQISSEHHVICITFDKGK